MHVPRSFLSFPACALALALVSISSFSPSIAIAAPSPKEKAEAKTLVESAKKALKERRFAEAMKALTQASTLDPGPAMEVEIAQAEIAAGKLVAASKRLTGVATNEGDGSPATKAARDAAKKTIAETMARIPSVKVVATGATGKVTMTIDGAEATAGSDESVDPGEHTIVVTIEGSAPASRKVTIAEGAHETVDVAAAGAAAPAEVGSSAESWIKPRLPGIIVAGAGGLTLVIGGVLGGLAIGATSDAKQGCTNNVCNDTPDRQDKISKAKTLGNASTGMLVAGGVVAAGGAVLIVLMPGMKKKDEPAKGARIGPWFGADQVGIAGTF